MIATPIVPGLLYSVRSKGQQTVIVHAINGADAIAKRLETCHG